MWELPPTPPDSEDGDGPAPTPARGRGRGRPAGVVGSRLARQLRDDALVAAGLLFSSPFILSWVGGPPDFQPRKLFILLQV